MANNDKQPVPYSLVAELYRSWEQYQIPTVFYHYILAILPKLDHKNQMLLMSKQIKSLKANTHPYHKIVNAIEARERSIQVIQKNIHVLVSYESTTEMDWPEYDNKDLQFGGDGYRVVEEDPKAGILSPRAKYNNVKNSLSELINHIRMYRKVTIQLIILIANWEQQLLSYGYNQAPVHFQYHKQDYLLNVPQSTLNLLQQYSDIFENNPFFMVKKLHLKTQYALIYQQLKPSQEVIAKIYQSMNILAQHEAKILKFRTLAKLSQKTNKYRKISKSSSLHKIYSNLNHGHDYIVMKDSEINRKSRVVADPPVVNHQLLKQVKRVSPYQNNLVKKSSSLKNTKLIINPEFKEPTHDTTKRKHPILLNSNFMGLAQEANEISQQYLLSPILPSKKKNDKPESSSNTFEAHKNRKSIKRNQTEDYLYGESQSEVLLEGVNVSHGHGSNIAEIQPPDNPDKNINKLNDANRNKGYTLQRKLEVLDQINKQKVINRKNLPKIDKYANLKQIKLFSPKQRDQADRQEEQSILNKSIEQEARGELSENSALSLVFEQSIKPTQIVRYLRNKVFNNTETTSQSVGFQEIQQLAKKLLIDKEHVTFIRVESRGIRVAWLAVKFIQKEQQTMKKAVVILYIRKFLKLSNFQQKLLDMFVAYGYGVIRNQHKILYQISILDIVRYPLVKIKYKVSVTAEKQEIKEIIKGNKSLAYSRILKYYYYSKTSKYHTFCEHINPNICSLTFYFRNMFKSSIDRVTYVIGMADKITKIGSGDMYKITSIANDGVICIVAKTLTQIMDLEKQEQIERDSSFDSKMETDYRYFGVRESKIMRKYVENVEESSNRRKYKYQETVVSQFITINGKIPQVKSISKTKEDAEKQQILLMDNPFFMGLATNEEGQIKTLAIIQFQ